MLGINYSNTKIEYKSNLYLVITVLHSNSNILVSIFPPEDGCFPSKAKTRLENGSLAEMSELHPGDRVQTGIIFNYIWGISEHQ